MLENIPSQSMMTELLGQTLYEVWQALCSAIDAKSNCVGFMIILGKDERAKFEDIRATLSDAVCRQYDNAQTYHDGKWVMFEPTDATDFSDYMKLLAIKRKPNRQ